MKRKIVLSIAASDTSGGAGIQADLKAFSYAGMRGLTIITCITAQNERKVLSVYPLPTDVIEVQAEALLSKLKPDVTKIGMLYSKEIAECTADLLKKYRIKKVVLDPVLSASTGDSLAKKDLVGSIKDNLLELTYLITPNISEAERLTGIKIKNIADMKQAAGLLIEGGARNVLIKGGHLKGKDAMDVFFDGKEDGVLLLPKLEGNIYRGTGCILSSLIAANLAKGKKLRESIDLSKRILWSMMLNSYPLKGSKVRILGEPKDIDIPPKNLDRERFDVWLSLNSSVKRLIKILPSSFIPEVGVNIGFALKNSKSREDVCALKGRITRAKTYGVLKFGASKHIASIILTAMKFDKAIRSALNIRYSSDLIERIKSSGLIAYSFNREEEPEYAKSTMEWGVSHVIKKYNRIPDVIWDEGGMGKESMIRILGKNPKEVIGKLKQILD